MFGSARDKPYQEQLTDLIPHFDDLILTAATSSQRCCPPEDLKASLLPSAEINISIAQTPVEAIEKARQLAQKTGLIVVSGSFYLAGEIRPLLKAWQEKRQPHSHVIA